MEMIIANDKRVSLMQHSVNSEIFARILFSRVAIKDIFAMLKSRDMGMVDDRVIVRYREDFIFTKIKTSRKFPNLQYCVPQTTHCVFPL